ncbi:unnamed protein product [Bathycoccus prasinos]
MSSATKALEKLAQKKRRESEMKKIQKEREEAAKKSSCCGGGHMREGKEIDSDYNSSDEEVELRDEDSSDDDDDDDDENQGAIKVGRKRVSLGSKKDKLIFGIKPLPFFFLCLFMFVPVFTSLDKFFKFSQPSGPNAYSHIRTPKQQEWYMKIKAYYEDVNPAKLGEVPRLLAKYKGREEKLYKALRKKYEKNYDPHKTREEF